MSNPSHPRVLTEQNYQALRILNAEIVALLDLSDHTEHGPVTVLLSGIEIRLSAILDEIKDARPLAGSPVAGGAS